jgi:hypothetical protein
VTRLWAIVPMATGSDREGQLGGQLPCLDFGYHIGIKGFRGFLVSPRPTIWVRPRTSANIRGLPLNPHKRGFFMLLGSWERRSLPLTSGGNLGGNWPNP